VWLYRTAPNDIAEPWALTLFRRCRAYNVLPAAGGAYDQDEYVMTAMEQAAGVSALFDADGVTLLASQERLDLHEKLGLEAAAIIACINDREAVANGEA
jgi:hypothetical protein